MPGLNNVFDFPRLLERLHIHSVMYEWYDTAEHFLKYFPLCNQNIIDTHELYYVKEARRYAVGGRASDERYLQETRDRELDIYRMADALVAISDEEKRILEKEFPRKKIVLLPTWGNPPGRGTGKRFEDRKDIVFFASFYNREQFDAVTYFLADIFPRIRKALPGVRLHIAGDRSFLLEKDLQAAGNRDRVVVDGKVPDIYRYLRDFRVFVCPLRYGAGLKKKILDAAIAGCPVVTTRIGVEGYDMRHGKEVLIGQDAASFARQVIAAYTDGRLWRALSRNAAKRAARRNPYGQNIEQLQECLDAAS